MAHANFAAALAEILRQEGGYAEHPADPGGPTMLGITQATLASWRGRPVSAAEVRALDKAEAGEIYRARYWTPIRGDDLPDGLDLAIFDFAVNSGPSRAVRLLQKLLKVSEDGRLGPITLQAMQMRDRPALIAEYCEARRNFLRGLATWPVFGAGWSRRVETIEAAALRLAKAASVHPSLPSPRSTESLAMDVTKSVFLSKTLWANAIGLIALALSIFGFNTAGLDPSALAEQILQAIAAASFVFSSVFRVIATKKIG